MAFFDKFEGFLASADVGEGLTDIGESLADIGESKGRIPINAKPKTL